MIAQPAFLLLERVVFESLCRGAKSLASLKNDTGVEGSIIEYILESFIKSSVCEAKDQVYRLTESGRKMGHSSGAESRKNEAMEFFSLFFERSQQDKSGLLQMKKIWMDEHEHMLYRQLLDRWNDFIQRVQKSNRERKMLGRKCGKLHEQFVILFGSTRYSDLIEQSQRTL